MMANVSGEIYTEMFQSVEEVEVQLASTLPIEMTNEQGEYAFDQMPIGETYTVTPAKDTGYLNGVSTLDLVLLQRHILGIERLPSSYSQIAADINNDKSINGIDLVELRKLILGIYVELPENTSWRFVDVDHEFSDPENPWITEIAEDYRIDELEQNMDIDFIGVKIGDLSGDVIANLSSQPIDQRSNRWSLVFEMTDNQLAADELITIPVYSRNYERVSGWQLTFEFDTDNVEVMDVIGKSIDVREGDYNLSSVDKGWFTISHSSTKEESFEDGELLYELVVRVSEDMKAQDVFQLSSKVTRAEAYRGYSEVVNVELAVINNSNTNIVSVTPNPWISRTSIEFNMSEEGLGLWEFYDINGRLIHAKQGTYTAGRHVMHITKDEIRSTGIVYVKLTTADGVVESKMMVLE